MSTPRYTATAIALHWLIAAGIVGSFALGLYMHDLPFSPTKLKLVAWHKWAGVTLFVLVCARLAWRLGHRPPPLPEAMPAPLRRAAGAAHALLYLLMFAVPLTGWLMSSAKGVPTVWFGAIPLPDLVAKDADLAELLQILHRAFNYTLAGLVLAHAGAALKHHFVDRDDVLARMLPHRAAGKHTPTPAPTEKHA